MNKKFLIAWVAIFVLWMLGSFLVHGTLLRADYDTLVKLGVFRAPAEAEKLFPVMILAHIIMAGAFVWIYERGVETAKPWLAQGLRFGIAVALLGVIAGYMIYYVVLPMPGATAVKQIVFDGVLVLILGAVVAWLYRTTSA